MLRKTHIWAVSNLALLLVFFANIIVKPTCWGLFYEPKRPNCLDR